MKKFFKSLKLMAMFFLFLSNNLNCQWWHWDSPKIFKPEDIELGAGIGEIVAITSDSKYLASSGYTDNSNRGSVWISQKDIDGNWDWKNSIKLSPTNPLGKATEFGYKISFADDAKTLAVGGFCDGLTSGDCYSKAQGGVWIYQKIGDSWNWNNPIKLVPTNFIGDDVHFGETLAFTEDSKNLAICGYRDNKNKGAVWIYSKDKNGTWDWNNSIKLTPTNPIGDYSNFGSHIAFSKDSKVLIVGGWYDNFAKGSIWIYQKDLNGNWNWSNPKKITAPFGPNTGLFGPISFSHDNQNIFIRGVNGEDKDIILIYGKDKSGNWDWNNLTFLMPIDHIGQACFGDKRVLTNDNNMLFISGSCDNGNAGAIWVTKKNGNSWGNLQKIVPNDLVGKSFFGYGLGISPDNNYLSVGGIWDNNYQGGVWVYKQDGLGNWNWNQPIRLLPGDYSGSYPKLGENVIFTKDNRNLMIGATGYTGTGAVFVYNNYNESLTTAPTTTSTEFITTSQTTSSNQDNLSLTLGLSLGLGLPVLGGIIALSVWLVKRNHGQYQRLQ